MEDHANYSLEPNIYLEMIKTETNEQTRLDLLAKYFTERVSKNFYHNMDLLNNLENDSNGFISNYELIKKDIFNNIIIAIQKIAEEKGTLDDELKIQIDNYVADRVQNPRSTIDIDNKYSICDSIMQQNRYNQPEK